MGVRRVITGHNEDGRSVIVADQTVEGLRLAAFRDAPFYDLWGTDEPPSVPNGGAIPSHPLFFPGVEGARVVALTFPPSASGASPDPVAAAEEVREKLPGLLEKMERDTPGMHTTDTVDVDVIMAGELFLELDDGVEVQLRTGDVVIQNGTRHRWINRGGEPCFMLSVLIGAHRR